MVNRHWIEKWEVFDVQILTALTVLHTLWWRGLKPAFICFTVEKSLLDRFWKKCFVCFSFRRPGAPPCRWCRARRRQRARKHRLNWGWVHCSTALTHAVSKMTAVRPTHQSRRQSRFLKSFLFAQFSLKRPVIGSFLVPTSSSPGWLSETYSKTNERCRERKCSVWALLLPQDAKKDETIRWTVSRWSCCDWLSSAFLEQQNKDFVSLLFSSWTGSAALFSCLSLYLKIVNLDVSWHLLFAVNNNSFTPLLHLLYIYLYILICVHSIHSWYSNTLTNMKQGKFRDRGVKEATGQFMHDPCGQMFICCAHWSSEAVILTREQKGSNVFAGNFRCISLTNKLFLCCQCVWQLKVQLTEKQTNSTQSFGSSCFWISPTA